MRAFVNTPPQRGDSIEMKKHLDRLVPAVITLLTLCLTLAVVPAETATSESKGPETLVIDGGRKGNITLPHREHQQNLQDCKICHRVFPKKLGSIKAMKDEGNLKKKQVMNKVCLNCHRSMKKAGKDTGPTSCSGCHKK